jgi:hypothetical protein
MTFEKASRGYRRTKALSRDEAFDVVWSALKRSTLRP